MTSKWTKATAVCGLLAAMVSPAMADSFELSGIVRDLKRGDLPDGHPDFQTAGSMGRFGHVKGLVSMELGEDGKPVYNSDRPSKDTIQSAESLAAWYNDVPNVNASQGLEITLDNGQSTEGGVYTYSSNSFFPINGQILGNQGLPYNFHFTFELHTTFTYTPGQTFKFTGDDDVWVYVNGIKVIDLGGVHSAVNGEVLLFDGKVFVEKDDFPLSSLVQQVSSSMRSQLQDKWENLGLPGNCPVDSGDRYVDLNLNDGGPDARVDFNGDSVTVHSAQDLSNITLVFADGTNQTITGFNNGVTSGTFEGTQYNGGKSVKGVYVKSTDNATGGNGKYFDVGGSGYDDKTLDFFFAERHTTQSNFRIDTNMKLHPVVTHTISPLYD